MTQSQSQMKSSLPTSLQRDVVFDASFLDFLIDFRLKSEPQSELYNFHARFYDPEIGRFISYDAAPPSLEQPLSLNRYSYVYNNPLKFVDPDGNRPVNFEAYFRYAWRRDFGGSPEIAMEKGTAAAHRSAVWAGDQVQAIPEPILSGGAFVSGGLVLAGMFFPALLPIGKAGGYLFTTLSAAKTGLDYYEGNTGYSSFLRDAGSIFSTRIPLVGPAVNITYDGGSLCMI